MFRKASLAGPALLMVILGAAVSYGQQQPPAAPISSGAHEFPAVMRQNVVAGATAVGTKVQARLVIATLVDGVVIPRDAVLSGEVTESAAKSARANLLALPFAWIPRSGKMDQRRSRLT
jgi:hypothetical protein